MDIHKLIALLIVLVGSAYKYSFVPKAEKFVSTSVIKAIYWTSAQRAAKCRAWHARDPGVGHLTLPRCPPTEQQAKQRPQFAEDKAPPELHHPGADRCYRSGGGFWATAWHLLRHRSDPGGQQCCYTKDKLLTDGPGAGSADRGAYLWNHWWHDVLPSYYCCMDGDAKTCQLYREKRPTDTG